jgi:hypothetical protein
MVVMVAQEVMVLKMMAASVIPTQDQIEVPEDQAPVVKLEGKVVSQGWALVMEALVVSANLDLWERLVVLVIKMVVLL